MVKDFRGSLLFSLVALSLAAAFGWMESGTVSGSLATAFQAAVLAIMETSLSIDNAVVNSTILGRMDQIWARRFTTWGMLVAVFGMRLLFPVLIVSVAAGVGIVEAARIAIEDHGRYEAIVTGAHAGISGYGGTFLLLVGTRFFIDTEREHHWIPLLERPLAAMARLPLAAHLLALGVAAAVSAFVPADERLTFLLSAAAGYCTFLAVAAANQMTGRNATRSAAGLMAFLQLEIIDASFSFDGVMGAFAITNDILIIAIGLGIGAMFVRSMTVSLSRGGTLSEYRYLEAGAFYAVSVLSLIMIVEPVARAPEMVTGLLGAAIMAASMLASIRHRRLHPHEYENDDPEVRTPLGDVIPVEDI